MRTPAHQYIDGRTGRIRSERPMGDRFVNFLYSEVRESAPLVFRAFTSSRSSSILGYLNFEPFLSLHLRSAGKLMHHWGVDPSQCLEEPGPPRHPLQTVHSKDPVLGMPPHEQGSPWGGFARGFTGPDRIPREDVRPVCEREVLSLSRTFWETTRSGG